jgi:hypothetical protein
MIANGSPFEIRYTPPTHTGGPIGVRVRNSEDALLRARHLAAHVGADRLTIVDSSGLEYSLSAFERAMNSAPVEVPALSAEMGPGLPSRSDTPPA